MGAPPHGGAAPRSGLPPPGAVRRERHRLAQRGHLPAYRHPVVRPAAHLAGRRGLLHPGARGAARIRLLSRAAGVHGQRRLADHRPGPRGHQAAAVRAPGRLRPDPGRPGPAGGLPQGMGQSVRPARSGVSGPDPSQRGWRPRAGGPTAAGPVARAPAPTAGPLAETPRMSGRLHAVLRRFAIARAARDLIRRQRGRIAFRREFVAFARLAGATPRFPLRWGERQPRLDDRTRATPFDAHYVYHTAWAARCVAAIAPEVHVDISSSLHFCTIVSAFMPVRFYDYRPAALRLSGLASGQADLSCLRLATGSVASL